MSRLLTILFFLLLYAGQCEADLIVNGSFETPTVPDRHFTSFSAGSTAITGWTVVGVETAVVSGNLVDGLITANAQHGNQWIDLAGDGTNSKLSGVSQDILTTPGQAYELVFYVGSVTNSGSYFPSTVDLSIDGGTRLSFTNPTAPTDKIDWLRFAHTFSATSASTNVTFFNGSEPRNFISALDNVSLSAVPEPSSAILAGIAVLAVASCRIRRKLAKQSVEI